MSNFNIWLKTEIAAVDERLDRDIVTISDRCTLITQHLYPCKVAVADNWIELLQLSFCPFIRYYLKRQTGRFAFSITSLFPDTFHCVLSS